MKAVYIGPKIRSPAWIQAATEALLEHVVKTNRIESIEFMGETISPHEFGWYRKDFEREKPKILRELKAKKSKGKKR
jgi:hypothetical protein